MAPRDRSNRVQVDVQLLRDENMRMLESVFEKFEQQVDRLVNEGIKVQGGTAGAGGPGETSGHESRAPTPSIAERVRDDLISQGVLSMGDQGVTVSPQASVAGGGRYRPTGIARFGYGATGPNQYEEAQFHLGQVPYDTLGRLRYLSYLSERRAYTRDDEGRITGEAPGALAAGARRFSGGLGLLAQGAQYGQAFYQQLNAMPGVRWINPMMMNEMAQPGVNVGLSRSGLLGTPYFSPAYMNTLGTEWQAYRRSRWNVDLNWNPLKGFGIPGSLFGNPNYTRAQATEAINIANQYGWTGRNRDQLLDMMEATTRRYGGAIPQEMVTQLMDPGLRFGTTNRREVEQSLDDLAEAARSAHMNLQQFSQQAFQAAEGLSQSVGISGARALRQVTALSEATGLGPSVAGQILSNRSNLMLGMAVTGQQPWEAVQNIGRTATAGQFAMLGAMGITPQRWRTAGSQEKDAMKNQMAMIYLSNPDVFGGMTPQQVIDQMNRSIWSGVDTAHRVQGIAQIGNILQNVPGGEPRRQALAGALRSAGVRQRVVQGFLEAATTGHSHNATVRQAMKRLGLDRVDPGSDVGRLAKSLLGQREDRAGAAARRRTQVDIGVRPPFDQMFTAMISNTKGKSHSNSSGWFSRNANNLGDMASHIPGVGGELGGALHAAGAIGGWLGG
jgi:hypothetical protein